MENISSRFQGQGFALYSSTSIATVRVIAHPFYGAQLYTLGIYAGSKLKNFLQWSIIAVVEHMEL